MLCLYGAHFFRKEVFDVVLPEGYPFVDQDTEDHIRYMYFQDEPFDSYSRGIVSFKAVLRYKWLPWRSGWSSSPFHQPLRPWKSMLFALLIHKFSPIRTLLLSYPWFSNSLKLLALFKQRFRNPVLKDRSASVRGLNSFVVMPFHYRCTSSRSFHLTNVLPD